MGKKKPPICNVGDRISGPGKSQGVVEHNAYTSIKPYKIRWDNGLFGIYNAKDFDKYGYKIHPPEAEVKPEVEETPAQIPLDFSRDQRWREGDRVTTLIDSDWQPGELIVVNASDLENIKVKAAGYEIYSVIDSGSLRAWNSLKPADCSRDKEASPVQLSLLGDSTGKSQLKTTKTRSQSLRATSTIESSEPTSGTFTQTQASLMQLLEASPVPELVEQETGRDSTTQNQPCLESSCDASAKQSLSSSSLSNLWDLSIEDLEHGWGEQQWQDTKASIRSSLDAINLERNFRESESLSFPTLLSGRGRGCRDAGLTKCEVWWKQNVIQEIGLQLSAEAIALLHGFPSNWYRSISPPSVARQGTQDGLQPENSEDKPLPSPRQELLLSGLSGSTKSLRVKTSELLRLLNWEEEQLDEYWDGQSFVTSGYSIRWLGATASHWEIEAIESPQNTVPGDSRSLEKFEFYVTVSAGSERPELMPDDLYYLFVASSFWNRGRAKVKSFPRPPLFPAGKTGVRTAADAGGYIAAKDWGGKYPYTPAQYVEWLLNWCNGWAATMDLPCEPPLTGGDRRQIRHRQKQTTKYAWHFWNNYQDVPWQWVPTIQGWDVEDYVHHATELKPLLEEMRQKYGKSFRVGIGSLCTRASNAQIKAIVEAVSTVLPGFQFHLWGVKQNAASVIKLLPQVISSDSAAWDGLAGPRDRKVWEEEYRGKIPRAEYIWTIALPKYINSLEQKLGVSVRGDRRSSLEKFQILTTPSRQTGSLYQYTANREDKAGITQTYPKVEGERRRDEDSHWYWGFSYIEKSLGKWRDKSAAIPRKKLSAVRKAIADGKPHTYILQEILGK